MNTENSGIYDSLAAHDISDGTKDIIRDFNDAVNDDCPGRVCILLREHHVGECVAGRDQILVPH